MPRHFMREADSLNAPGSMADYLENRVFIPINDLEYRAVEALPIQGDKLSPRKILFKAFFRFFLLVLQRTYLSLDVSRNMLLFALCISKGGFELFNFLIKWFPACGFLLLQLCMKA